MDHALHLGLVVLALAAFLVVPVGVAVPILVITGGVVIATVAASMARGTSPPGRATIV